MNQLSKAVIGTVGGAAVLVGIGWLGLQVSLSNLPAPVDVPQDLGTVEIPAGLPAYTGASLLPGGAWRPSATH